MSFQKRKRKWPPSERLLLLNALKKHGTRNVEEVRNEMMSHTKEELQEIINKEKRMQVTIFFFLN
jgi:hypothetical protein